MNEIREPTSFCEKQNGVGSAFAHVADGFGHVAQAAGSAVRHTVIHGHDDGAAGVGVENVGQTFLGAEFHGASSCLICQVEASGGIYKKGRRLVARGLKFCVLGMSAILPTTGPAKVKEEAKAEGAGFDLADGGRSTDHG